MSDESPSCGSISNDTPRMGLRIGSIFIILVTSAVGTLFPVIAKRALRIPTAAFDFVKYFGSGVIVRSVASLFHDSPASP